MSGISFGRSYRAERLGYAGSAGLYRRSNRRGIVPCNAESTRRLAPDARRERESQASVGKDAAALAQSTVPEYTPLISLEEDERRGWQQVVTRRSAFAVPCCLGCAAIATKLSRGPGADGARQQQPWFDKRFAETMQCGMRNYEARVVPIKEELFGEAGLEGAVLAEVGLGAAPSLGYYAAAGVKQVIGVEPNLAMHPMAASAAERYGLDLRLVAGFAEALPLEDSSVDVVVGTMLMCSVSDMVASAREILRVLRPGGRYVYVEHVAAPPLTTLRAMQTLFDPLQQATARGCHLTRDPTAAIAQAGFSRVDATHFSLGQRSIAAARAMPSSAAGGWRPEEGLPPPHFLLSPHLGGIAVKGG